MPNRLENEISPYLLQHANNPVSWNPWDDAALQHAKTQNKPIFLSIGYAACHWCHVMERESFQDPHIAELLNEGFIPIKVDREERPDLDNIYMNAVVSMTGQGGWPLNVFLTPDGVPFFGGTYFPPINMHGRPAFEEILISIRSLWEQKQGEVLGIAQNIRDHLSRQAHNTGAGDPVEVHRITHNAAQSLLNTADREHGGWGAAPKFPQPMLVEFLLMRASRGQKEMLAIAEHTLMAMSQGGMYDLAGGGFHRYSTDGKWLVPHFEKMLYDNALLARAYLHAYLLTGNTAYKKVCTKTLDFVASELKHPAGGFYSSLDADSEGVEGKYYVWSHSELKNLLQDRFEVLKEYLDITPSGNFDGKIIPRKMRHDASNPLAHSEGETSPELEEMLQMLAQHRQERIRPALDDKVILGWNAFALQAFAEAAFYFGDDRYLRIAQSNADFLLTHLIREDRVYRVWRENELRSQGFLEDYAALITGLIALHQADRQPRWLVEANRITNLMTARFDDSGGGFFDTALDHEKLIYRPKDLADNATPSGNSLAVMALLKMSSISDNDTWRKKARGAIQANAAHMEKYPTAYGNWLQALDFLEGPVQQIAILWPEGSPERLPFFNLLKNSYMPRSVILGSDLSTAQRELSFVDLLQNRGLIHTEPTAYICDDFACQLPTNDVDRFRELIGG